jgi:predicted CoA-binding protein
VLRKERGFEMRERRVVAVIGASRSRAKFGNRAVRAYRAEGWTVYPVHLDADEIEGLPALASIADVPERVHRATVYLPPERVLEILEEIARKGVDEMYLNPGAESSAVIARAQELGIQTVLGCSIVEIGRSPEHPD